MSIYQGFDLTNPNDVHLLGEGLHLYLAGSHRPSNSRALNRMDITQRDTFGYILGQMDRDQEFYGIVAMLIDLRGEDDRVILRAAEDVLEYGQNLEVGLTCLY